MLLSNYPAFCCGWTRSDAVSPALARLSPSWSKPSCRVPGRHTPWSWGCRGRMKSPSDAMGSKGERQSPLPRRRRLVSKGSGTPFGRWGLGSAEGSPLVRTRLDADFRAIARGMQRESAASPLPRSRCKTTHILRAALSPAFRPSIPAGIKIEPGFQGAPSGACTPQPRP